MKIIKVKNTAEAGLEASKIISETVNKNSHAVLGLATGSSPITTYENLIKLNKSGKVDFSNVTSFNLDEYKGLEPTHNQSYRYFMNEKLFDHININKENTFVPSGINTENPGKYDEDIKNAGGIDLQLLGLGINGHVGFNEPGTSFDSMTSVVKLTDSTIEANSRMFEKKSDVPTEAVSMGLKSIMLAKEIVLIATGLNKAEAVKALIEGEITTEWPCSILQKHDHVTVIIDEEAASLLTK
ncbi:glucosamine-6-phosphate deaminase [Mesoplasma photuris]|uniref:glucosamine-6-phosphate deaminase n=1 Tax=Mesoplasma photuris TaxID=217731 RepID=UPI0004E1218F|nr:glucosamine-6-phosphate deaminase [Mesoplasma photuris]